MTFPTFKPVFLVTVRGWGKGTYNININSTQLKLKAKKLSNNILRGSSAEVGTTGTGFVWTVFRDNFSVEIETFDKF